jgi:CRP/FNR family transcriptional regulator
MASSTRRRTNHGSATGNRSSTSGRYQGPPPAGLRCAPRRPAPPPFAIVRVDKGADHVRDGKQERLKSTKLFSGLDRKELELVAGITTEVNVAAGTVLAREGHAGHDAFVIVSGTVDVSVGGTKVGSAGAGELVGEMALLLRDERQATITAATDLDVMVIEPGHFDQLLEQVPSVARALVVSLARRLRDADDQLRH